MAHESAVPANIPFRVLGSVPALLKILVPLLIVAGVAAVGLSLGDPARLWQAVLFNWLYFASIAIGMVVFAVALRLTNADWAWSIRRFALGGAAFLPVAFILLPVVLWGGREHVFHHWLHAEGDPVIAAKSAWLSWPGLGIRDLVVVGVLFGLALAFAYYSIRPDVYGKKGGLYGWLTQGFRGVSEEANRSWRVTGTLGVVLALAYALLWGVVAVDMAMSLNPHWFSTMFPVAFFWTAFVGGVAVTVIAAVLTRGPLGLEPYITQRQFHDLGKLLFAFSIFWMYLNWSQYIVIWYGQLPWEQEFFIQRFSQPFAPLAGAVVILLFVLPFLGLLARAPKLVPQVLVFFATVLLAGQWIERYLLIYPTLWEGGTEGALPLGLPEVGVALGFAGLFLGAYLWYLTKIPLLPSPATLAAREPTLVEVPA